MVLNKRAIVFFRIYSTSDSISVVDGAARNGQLVTELYLVMQPEEISPVYAGTQYANQLLRGLHLIPIQYDNPLLEWYQQEERDIGILLFSHYSPTAITKHLQQYLTCILPDDRRKMFRFYDPFIFFYAWNSFTETEQSLFLGPIQAVVCPKPKQEYQKDHITFHFPKDHKYNPHNYDKGFPWFISEATYKALNKPSQYTLTKLLFKNFKQSYPKSFKILGKDRIWTFCEKIVQMNETLKLVYMDDLMVLLGITSQMGTGFLSDPQYTTVAIAMENGDTPQEKLYAMANELERMKTFAWGKHGKPYYIALKKLYHTPYEDLCQLDSNDAIVAGLESIFPEQAHQAGKKALFEITELGRHKSKEWGLLPCPGAAISTGILFFLGTGCEQDPLRPWISAFIAKQMPPEEKTLEIFKAFKRIIRFNLRTRTLDLEQQYALWLNQCIEPLRNFTVHSQMPQHAQNLDAALLTILPMLEDEFGEPLVDYAKGIVSDSSCTYLPLPLQILLALVCIAEEAILHEDDARINVEQIVDLYQTKQPDRAFALLEDRLAWIVRHIELELHTEFGGDIL